MKKIDSLKKWMLACLVIASMGMLQAQVFTGSGTMADPFQLSTKADLEMLAVYDDSTHIGATDTVVYNDAHYKLTANIDFMNDTLGLIAMKGWNGSFNGNNMIIENVVVTPASRGFFDVCNLDTIYDLGFVNVTVTKGGGERIGLLWGEGGSNVSNCFALDCVVKGGGRSGGFIGLNNKPGTTVSDCFAHVDITGSWGVGGFVGNGAPWWDIADPVTYVNNVFYGTVNAGNAFVSIGGGKWDNLILTNNYYITTCGKTDDNATGLSPWAMTQQAEYADFDFTSVWMMSTGGYAVLKSFSGNSAIDYSSLSSPTKPVADGGGNQNQDAGTVVTLDGSNSISNADPSIVLTYTWSKIADAPALSATDVAAPTFTAPNVSAITDYKYILTVNNGSESSDPDTVVITILPVTQTVGDTLDRAFWEVFDATSDAANGGGEAGRSKILDGDLTTNWSSEWSGDHPPTVKEFPIHFSIDMVRSTEVATVIYEPRYDPWGPGGCTEEYEIFISDDKENWGTAVKTGSLVWPEYDLDAGKQPQNEKYMFPQVIVLDAPVTGRYIKFNTKTQMLKTETAHVVCSEFYILGTYKDADFGAMTADAGDDQTVKVGMETTLDASASSTDDRLTLKYMWEAPSFITLSDTKAEMPTFSTDSIGTHMFYVTVDDSYNEPIMDSVKVTVEALTTVDVTFKVTDNGQPVVAAVVTFNGAIQTTGVDGMTTYSTIDVGDYKYSVIAGANILPETDITLSKDTTVNVAFGAASINELAAQSVKCYPNPATNLFTVSSITPIHSISVYSISGQLAYSENSINSLEKVIDVQNLENGIYFTEIRGEGFTKTIKVVVE